MHVKKGLLLTYNGYILFFLSFNFCTIKEIKRGGIMQAWTVETFKLASVFLELTKLGTVNICLCVVDDM